MTKLLFDDLLISSELIRDVKVNHLLKLFVMVTWGSRKMNTDFEKQWSAKRLATKTIMHGYF